MIGSADAVLNFPTVAVREPGDGIGYFIEECWSIIDGYVDVFL